MTISKFPTVIGDGLYFYVVRELRDYLHNLKGNEKNDLFFKEYVPQQHLSLFLEFLLRGKWQKDRVGFQSLYRVWLVVCDLTSASIDHGKRRKDE